MQALDSPPLVDNAKKLASANLRYMWGSADSARGGLDCSGFMMEVFRKTSGLSLPDEAGKQFNFIRAHGKVWDASTGGWNKDELQPGDLIFWSGTRPCKRPSPITHVMMYIGNNTMVGSQNAGRRIGQGGNGVGFYRFNPRIPRGSDAADSPAFRSRPLLYGYGRLPASDSKLARTP